MQQYRREWIPGGTYFFTVNTYQRQKLLTKLPFYQALKASIKEVRKDHPFEIIAFVLLPDHLHCIWTLPENDGNYSLRWSLIKRKVSQETRIYLPDSISDSRIKRHESGLWQRRFWEHRIRDENDLEMHVNYVHYNPVKHGYVNNVSEWSYSSFHRYARKGILPVDWGGFVEPVELSFGER